MREAITFNLQGQKFSGRGRGGLTSSGLGLLALMLHNGLGCPVPRHHLHCREVGGSERGGPSHGILPGILELGEGTSWKELSLEEILKDQLIPILG